MAKPKAEPFAFQELGVSGLRRWGGYIDEEIIRELRGQRAARVYKEISETDDIAGAVLLAITSLAKGVEIRVAPGREDAEGAEQQEFVRQALMEDMSQTWSDFLSDALTMLTYGWAFHEVVYKHRGGDSDDPTERSKFTDDRIGVRKIVLRAQDSLDHWNFDDAGGVQAMVQRVPDSGELRTIPIQKALLFRTTTLKNNPEGRSLLANAYRSWYFKKNIQQIEAIGIERDLNGYPTIKLEKDGPDIYDATKPAMLAMRASLEKTIRLIRRDEQEGAILPWWCNLQLLSSGSRRTFDTSAIITRYDQRIAMTMLADFVLLGHDAVGSKALSVSKIDVFTQAMQGILEQIVGVINRFLIPMLVRLNGWVPDAPPQLKVGSITNVDLSAVGDYLQKLGSAGMPLFPNLDLERHLLKLAKLPAPAEDEGGGEVTVRRDELEALRQQAAAPPPQPAAGGQPPAVEKKGEPPRWPKGDVRGGQFRGAGTGTGSTNPLGVEGRAASLLTDTAIAARAGQIAQSAPTALERDNAVWLAKGEIAFEREMAAAGGDTLTRHTGPDGRWTAERAAVHEQILRETGSNAPRNQTEPVAIIMGGPSGAGKTTAVGQGLDLDDKVYINADDFKVKLPEYNGANAGVVHEESAYLADSAFGMAVSNRQHLVLDITMKGTNGTERKIAHLRENGYRVEIRFVDVTVETSVERTLDRYLRKEKAGEQGRYIRPAYVRAGADSRWGTRHRATFERIKSQADAWLLVNNDGRKPRRIASHGTLSKAFDGWNEIALLFDPDVIVAWLREVAA